MLSGDKRIELDLSGFRATKLLYKTNLEYFLNKFYTLSGFYTECREAKNTWLKSA